MCRVPGCFPNQDSKKPPEIPLPEVNVPKFRHVNRSNSVRRQRVLIPAMGLLKEPNIRFLSDSLEVLKLVFTRSLTTAEPCKPRVVRVKLTIPSSEGYGKWQEPNRVKEGRKPSKRELSTV